MNVTKTYIRAALVTAVRSHGAAAIPHVRAEFGRLAARIDFAQIFAKRTVPFWDSATFLRLVDDTIDEWLKQQAEES